MRHQWDVNKMPIRCPWVANETPMRHTENALGHQWDANEMPMRCQWVICMQVKTNVRAKSDEKLSGCKPMGILASVQKWMKMWMLVESKCPLFDWFLHSSQKLISFVHVWNGISSRNVDETPMNCQQVANELQIKHAENALTHQWNSNEIPMTCWWVANELLAC